MFAGIDWARRRDHSAIVIVEREPSRFLVAAAHRLPHAPWAEQVSWARDLTHGCVGIAADSTGVGDPVIEMLRGQTPVPVHGVHFTAATKQSLVTDLIETINAGHLAVAVDAPGAGALQEELSRFAMSPTRTGIAYSGKRNGTDDLVIALCLAVRAGRLPASAWRQAA